MLNTLHIIHSAAQATASIRITAPRSEIRPVLQEEKK
jgi:hypothetical protein